VILASSVASIADRKPSGYEQVVTPSAPQRTRRALSRRPAATFLLALSLLLSGCPVSSVAGAKSGARGEDPGPPTVFDPTLLDRG
jgi:hypothetical protein